MGLFRGIMKSVDENLPESLKGDIEKALQRSSEWSQIDPSSLSPEDRKRWIHEGYEVLRILSRKRRETLTKLKEVCPKCDVSKSKLLKSLQEHIDHVAITLLEVDMGRSPDIERRLKELSLSVASWAQRLGEVESMSLDGLRNFLSQGAGLLESAQTLMYDYLWLYIDDPFY
ncbi:MAG: hypothetical protein J7L37_01670, partial [Thermococcus sp.]|nr:hypothetical protein [Thermococcus sp.]